MSSSRDHDLLAMMLADMQTAEQLYRPTRFWVEASKLILGDLDRLGVSTFRSHKSAELCYVPTYANRRLTAVLRKLLALAGPMARLLGADAGRIERGKQFFLNMVDGTNDAANDYRVLVAADNGRPPGLLDLSESDYGAPMEHFSFEGRRYSRSFLRYLTGLAYLKKAVDAEGLETALEIGGGFGTLGEILASLRDREGFYVNVDIPPLAFVATRYLQAVLGESAVAGYDLTRDMDVIDLEDLRRKHRAVVLCSWQLPRVRGMVDLFVNFASFQEMEPHVVQNYVRRVQPLTRRWVLLNNRAAGKPVAGQPGQLGVEQPTVRSHYLGFFSEFELVCADTIAFGRQNLGGNPAEMMLLRRKGV